MMKAIGFVELNSIARGYEVADTALKTSEIEPVLCRAGCPGKFYFLFRGYPATVAEAMKTAERVGGENVIDRTIIDNIEEDVFRAMSMTSNAKMETALGVMEFFSVTASVYAADAAVKAADVRLMEIRVGMGIGGKSFVTLTGSVSAVEAAVKAGVSAENAKGMLIHSSIISNPDPALASVLY